MNIIIFSKDRGCQLELLLRSMKIHFKEWDKQKISILYTYSNVPFKNGYEITKKLHPEFNYVLEKDFKKDLLSLMDKTIELSTFLVDDIIFKEDFSMGDEKIKQIEEDGDVLCLSLRLHPNLTYCYPAKVKMISPYLHSGYVPKHNKFTWYGKTGDFGYPMSLDGSIFRTYDIMVRLEKLNYNNPITLESNLAASPIMRPIMMMFDKSIIVNNPVNKVQTFNQNVHGNISADFINEQYLKGKKISL